MYGDSIRQDGVKDCFAQTSPASVLGRKHELPSGRFVAAKIGNSAFAATAALEQLVGQVWVACGQSPGQAMALA